MERVVQSKAPGLGSRVNVGAREKNETVLERRGLWPDAAGSFGCDDCASVTA